MCREIHSNEDAAYDCCAPEVTEGYLCDCGAFHHLKINALSCCNSEETEDMQLTPMELEAAGQMRLSL